jgi:mannose-6-phosphate isomerase-like protein (cupin superfamily)
MRMSLRPGSRLLGRGATFHVPPSAIHRVQHAGRRPAVTLHCYSPPLRRAGAYSVGPSGELLRSAQSFAQELRAQPALL